MRLCRMKIKHLGAIFIFASLFMYGIIQTLYLLSPALERLSHHLHSSHSNHHLDSKDTSLPNADLPNAPAEVGSKDDRFGPQNVYDHPLKIETDNKLAKHHTESRDHLLNHARQLQKKQKSGLLKVFKHKKFPRHNRQKANNGTKNVLKFKSRESTPPKIITCSLLLPPTRPSDSKTWKTVVEGKVHVFSAFYESRLWQPAVRIIAVMDQSSNHGNLSYCQVWSQKTAQPEIMPFEASMIPEGHLDKRFAVYIITCRLRSEKAPVAVSLVESECDEPQVHLTVLNIESSREKRVDFTVCVTPLHFHYNNVKQFVEMVEINRLFGAKRFVFYNYSIGSDLAEYIETYAKEGIAEVVPWKIPLKVDTWPEKGKTDIHYFGQLASLNDCLYRNMYRSRYLVFSDLDELIVPKANENWKQILLTLQKEFKQLRFSKFGAFLFQCVFFRTDWPDDDNMTSNTEVRKYDVQTLLKTKREKEVFPWGMRSKYIIDPLKVATVGIHNIWKFIANRYVENNVPASLGLLHHYRYWEEPPQYPWVVDTSLHNYSDFILLRVRERHNTVLLYSKYQRRHL